MRRQFVLLVVPAMLLVIASLVAVAPNAEAQGQCEPFSGMIYGWYTDNWHAVMPLTIGHTRYQAKLLAATTGYTMTGDVWRGTETWTIDLGNGNTIQAKTHWVLEHVTDAASSSGVMHVTEGGQITGGTGGYSKAYGYIMSEGPGGPNVKLPPSIKTPKNAQEYWENPVQGMICQ